MTYASPLCPLMKGAWKIKVFQFYLKAFTIITFPAEKQKMVSFKKYEEKNKTGLQPVLRPLKQVPLFWGWVQSLFVPRLGKQRDKQTGLVAPLALLETNLISILEAFCGIYEQAGLQKNKETKKRMAWVEVYYNGL